MAIDALLFDFGGTLDGPGDPWVDRFGRIFTGMGFQLDPARRREAFGYATRHCYADPTLHTCGLHETVTRHVGWQLTDLGIDEPAVAQRVVTAFVDETKANLVASRALLAQLQPRVRLGVISNFYGNVARLLIESDIAPLLSVIIDSSVVGVAKPDPRIFAIALDRLSVRPQSTLYIGDSLTKDIAGAHAAGLHTAWLQGSQHDDADGANSPLKSASLMLRRAQHERESLCDTRLSAHPEPVEGRAESRFQQAAKPHHVLHRLEDVIALL